EPQRHTDGARALAVDAGTKIVEREARLGLVLSETRRQLGSCQAECDFSAARIAETPDPERDAGAGRAILHHAKVDRAAIGIVEVEADDASTMLGGGGAVKPHEGASVRVPQGEELIEQPSR